MKKVQTKIKEHPGSGHFENWEKIKIRGVKKFATMTGYSLSFIKAVQGTTDGVKAFKGNDILLLVFVRAANIFLSSTNEIPKPFGSWKDWKEMLSAKREEIFYKKDAGKVVDISIVERQIGEGVGYMFSELDRRDRELPPALAGRNSVEISERMLADTKAIKKTLAVKFSEIGR